MNNKTSIIVGITILIIWNKWFPSDREGNVNNLPPDVSYPKQQFKYWADMIDDALAKNMTENENVVYDVFDHMKKDADVQALIEMYGDRAVYFTFGTLYSLPALIASKLSSGERGNINQILASKGITLRF